MIQDMIETLAAAKVAMEENPKLQAQVEGLKYQLETSEDMLKHLGNAHNKLDEAHTSAQSRIAELEAQLESARFRELASREKLDKLVSSFRETIDEVAPANVPVAADANVEMAAEQPQVLIDTTHLQAESKEWNKPTIEEQPWAPNLAELKEAAEARVDERDPPAKAEQPLAEGPVELEKSDMERPVASLATGQFRWGKALG